MVKGKRVENALLLTAVCLIYKHNNKAFLNPGVEISLNLQLLIRVQLKKVCQWEGQ